MDLTPLVTLLAAEGGRVVGAVTIVCTEATDEGRWLLDRDKTGDVNLCRSCAVARNDEPLLLS